jgi:hypothetical protein
VEVTVANNAVMVGSRRIESVRDAFEGNLRNALGDTLVDELRANMVKRDGPRAHITLLNKDEGAQVVVNMERMEGIGTEEAIASIVSMARVIPDNWKARGIGRVTSGSKVAYFVVLDWPFGQRFRKALGLGAKDFHITLGFGPGGDVHDVLKNQVLSLAEL